MEMNEAVKSVKTILFCAKEIIDDMKEELGVRSNTDRRICIFATAKLIVSMLVTED